MATCYFMINYDQSFYTYITLKELHFKEIPLPLTNLLRGSWYPPVTRLLMGQVIVTNPHTASLLYLTMRYILSFGHGKLGKIISTYGVKNSQNTVKKRNIKIHLFCKIPQWSGVKHVKKKKYKEYNQND